MAENQRIKAKSLKNLKNLMQKTMTDIQCRGKRQSEKEEFGEEAPKSGQQGGRI